MTEPSAEALAEEWFCDYENGNAPKEAVVRICALAIKTERDAAYRRGAKDGGEWRGKLAEQCGRTLRAVMALDAIMRPMNSPQQIIDAYEQARRILEAEGVAPPPEGS